MRRAPRARRTAKHTGRKTMATNTTELEQLVVFRLSDGLYGINIARVSGIERVQEITHVPKTADYVEGIINLRGKVIPIVDLRKLFLLPPKEKTRDTRIVVVHVGGMPIGCLVDAVTEVLRISTDSVEPPSPMIASVSGEDYLRGIAKLPNRMILLLDLEKVMAVEKLRRMVAQAESALAMEAETGSAGAPLMTF